MGSEMCIRDSDRVQYHVDMKENASILLAEQKGKIIGQSIVRIEEDQGERFALFSTIYISKEYRKLGIAKKLIEKVLDWCRDKGIKKVLYNTAVGNTPIVSLFSKLGFREIHQSENDMIQLPALLE